MGSLGPHIGIGVRFGKSWGGANRNTPREPGGKMHSMRAHREGLAAAALLLLLTPWSGDAAENGLITFSRLAPGDLTGQVAVAEAKENADVTVLTSEGLLNADSYWSPDGSCIVFYSDRDGDSGELYAMDAGGGSQTRLTVHPAFDYDGIYSPDGTRLVFVSDRDGDYEIYLFDLANGAVQQLTNNNALDFTPDWSPDGTKIVFGSDRDGDLEIYTMSATGSDPVRLTDSPGFDAYPNWSPDGHTIVFATEREGTLNRDIWTMDADGNNQLALVTRSGNDSEPAFSPDGAMIAFACAGAARNHICIASSSNGSGLVQVTNDDLFDDRQPDWQPLEEQASGSLCPKITPKICGDANSDAAIKASDALAALRRGVGQPVVCPHVRCDVDNSGTITASDALRILRFSVGQQVTLECPDAEPAATEATGGMAWSIC